MDKSADSDTSTLDSAELEKSEMSPLTNDYDGDSGDHLLDIREDEAEDGAEVYRERISDPFSFQHPQPELFASSKVSFFHLFRHLLGITFQRFKLLCLAKDHWRGFSARNAHIVHVVNSIRFKIVEVSFYIKNSW